MSERMLTNAEKRRMKAVIKALIYGMEFCEEDEKKLIKNFIITQSLRLDSDTNPNVTTDKFFEVALKSVNDGKR